MYYVDPRETMGAMSSVIEIYLPGGEGLGSHFFTIGSLTLSDGGKHSAHSAGSAVNVETVTRME